MGLFDKLNKFINEDDENIGHKEEERLAFERKEEERRLKLAELMSNQMNGSNNDETNSPSSSYNINASDEIKEALSRIESNNYGGSNTTSANVPQYSYKYLEHKDDADWFFSSEAEYEFKNNLDTLRRTDFVIKYFIAAYKNVDVTIYYVVAVIIADGMYNSGIQSFSTLKGLLSEDTNPIVKLAINNKLDLKQISTNETINRMLCAIHNKTDGEFTFDDLTQLNSSNYQSSIGIYTLEREIIWFLSEKENSKNGFGPYDFFGTKDKIGRKNALDEEIEEIKKSKVNRYLSGINKNDISEEDKKWIEDMANSEDDCDSLYDDAVEFVIVSKKASTSLLQRRFGIGYNRAARLIDKMEDNKVIGPANGSKPREVYAANPFSEAVMFSEEENDEQQESNETLNSFSTNSPFLINLTGDELNNKR